MMTTTGVEMSMRPDYRYLLKLQGIILCLLLLVMLSACASTSTTIVEEEIVANQKPMYTYKTIVIRDFELKRELYTDAKEADMSRRDRLYALIPGELSEHIERYIKARRSYQKVLRNGDVNATTLVLKGRFTRLGRFRVSVIASLHDGASGQEVAYFRQTLWDVIDTTETINALGREIADFIYRIQYK